MQVLLIKMSSMGDMIHTLPALSDAANAFPMIRFDWVVEQAFAEIPGWHHHVDQVIPIQWRHWRKGLFQKQTLQGMRQFYQQLHAKTYDAIIDAQGLLKSMVVANLAKGPVHGPDRNSARESWASLGYKVQHTLDIPQHVIRRNRQLFAKSLGYPLPDTEPSYGINQNQLPQLNLNFTRPFLVFLHGTTWVTKHWPENYWQQLLILATNAGYTVVLPWGNEPEKERATRLSQYSPLAQVLPKLKIAEVGRLLNQAVGVVSVDSGLGHLSAALSVPTVAIYGPTNPEFLGIVGPDQVYLRPKDFKCKGCTRDSCQHPKRQADFPACFIDTTPEKVWLALQTKMAAYEKLQA